MCNDHLVYEPSSTFIHMSLQVYFSEPLILVINSQVLIGSNVKIVFRQGFQIRQRQQASTEQKPANVNITR